MAAVPEATVGAVAALTGGAHAFTTFAVAVVGVAVLWLGAFGGIVSVARQDAFAVRSADFAFRAVSTTGAIVVRLTSPTGGSVTCLRVKTCRADYRYAACPLAGVTDRAGRNATMAAKPETAIATVATVV